jgi:hypothetical protein
MSNPFYTWDGSAWSGVAYDVIPDSVIAQYDPTQQNTGTISTVSDTIGAFDLTGSVDVVSNGLNGKKTFEFNISNSNQNVSRSDTFTDTEPFAIVAVVSLQSSGSGGFVYSSKDSNSSDSFGIAFDMQNDTGGTWDHFRSLGGRNQNSSETIDTNTHIYTQIGENTSDNVLRIDGTEVNRNTAENAFIESEFKIGSRIDNVSYDSFQMGELVVLNNSSQSDIESEEQRLANLWGITI